MEPSCRGYRIKVEGDSQKIGKPLIPLGGDEITQKPGANILVEIGRLVEADIQRANAAAEGLGEMFNPAKSLFHEG